MNIIEVKNNLVKLAYDENISLASFIKINDVVNSYIAQIIHLESSRIGKIAIAKVVFNFKGGIQAYDGSAPSIQAEVEILGDDFFVNLLDKTDPLLVGKTGVDTEVVVSSKLLKDKPIICAEKSYQYTQLIENLINQNEQNGRKTVVIDITGEVKGNKIVATKDFKLPLNMDSIDYIFDRGFDDLTKENKAFIQDIFSELNEYIKTVEYIPFNDFSAVIDYEFKRTQQLQLIILKNRLTQFEKKGIFAQDKEEFKILDKKLESDNTLIIDLSTLKDSLQTEYIAYIYKQMEKQNTNFYLLVSLNDKNASKEIINSLFSAKNIFSSIVCPYSFKYLDTLKQCSKNMFMFTPIKQQSDFGAYNIYLNKLAEDEFILYGKSTKFIPVIVKLEEITDFSSVIIDKTEIMPSIETEAIEEKEELVDSETPVLEENIEIVEDATVQSDVQEEIQIVETAKEDLDLEIVEDVQENSIAEEVVFVQEQPEIIEEPLVEEKNVVEDTFEEEQVEIDEIEKSIVEQVENVQEEPNKIDFNNNDVVESISDRNEISDLLQQIQQGDKNIQPMNPDDLVPTQQVAVEDVDLFQEIISKPAETLQEQENAEELTDEDLDLIESLQDADESDSEKKNLIETEQATDGQIEINDSLLNDLDDESADSEVVESIEIQSKQQERQSITDEILAEEAQKRAEEQANKPDPIEQHIEKPQASHTDKKMETRAGSTPIVPVYSAEIPDEDIVESDSIQQGDQVVHTEFGKGIVEKIINYGDRVLCSINFEQIGRRLLDPKISELKKI